MINDKDQNKHVTIILVYKSIISESCFVIFEYDGLLF